MASLVVNRQVGADSNVVLQYKKNCTENNTYKVETHLCLPLLQGTSMNL